MAAAIAAGLWAGVLLAGGGQGRAAGWMLAALGAAGLAIAMWEGRPPGGRLLEIAGLVEVTVRERVLRAAGFLRAEPARRRLVAASLAAVALGAGWASVRVAHPPASLPTGPFLGTAAGDPRPFAFGWGMEAELEGLRVWLRGNREAPAIQAGEPLRVSGAIRQLEGDDGFVTWLRRRGVVAIVSVTDLERLGPARSPPMWLANAARSALARGAALALPEREAGLLLGLVIGDTSAMDAEVEEDFRATGLGHLVAVSGSNVAMVLAPVWGLAVLFGARRGARVALGTAAVALFALITRWEPSVLRASAMAILAMGGILAGRPRETGAILASAVALLLLADPALGWSLGFALSVAATLGIVALASRVASRTPFPRPVALAVGATVGAQLGVTPLLLAAFGVVPGATLVANLLAAPAVALAFLGGVAAGVGALVSEPLGRVLGGVARLPIAYLIGVADRTARLPVPSLVGFSWIAPAAALAAALLLARRARRPARVRALLLVPVAVWAVGIRGGPPSALTVTFFDVGQGDAALVRTPEGGTILIDAGPDEQHVATRLAALGVRGIDVAVASHAHADHVEGFAAVFARHPVGLLLDPGCPEEDSPSYLRMLAAAEAEGIEVAHPRGGEVVRLGSLRIEVLGPDGCSPGSTNDDSVVLRLRDGDATVLFPGDAEIPAQRDLLDDGDPIAARVLKVPHHGSKTSDPGFLAAVGSEVAIVSVGENDYGHPAPETLAALRDAGVRVVRTDLRGEVTVVFGADGLGLGWAP